MKCLILAAGYATRLYPLTRDFPKPLLEVKGRPILDWLIGDLEPSGRIESYAVVSNHRFAPIFSKWAQAWHGKVVVVDDGTSSNETRLGAVRDVQFAIESLAIDDDLLVIAGDNLLDFSLRRFLDYAATKGTSCVMRYYEPDERRLCKCGVISLGEDDLVVSMEEKPENPATHWCCPPFYFYARRDIPLVGQGISAGCGTDAPGSFIAWLCSQVPVHAMEMPGRRYDIGNLESYARVQEEFIPPEDKRPSGNGGVG